MVLGILDQVGLPRTVVLFVPVIRSDCAGVGDVAGYPLVDVWGVNIGRVRYELLLSREKSPMLRTTTPSL